MFLNDMTTDQEPASYELVSRSLIRKLKKEQMKNHHLLWLLRDREYHLRRFSRKIRSMKRHWYNQVPPFTMPFLEGEYEAVQKFIEDMTKWGRKTHKILGGLDSEFKENSEE